MTFTEFLWAGAAVTLNAVLLWSTGIAKLLVRQKLLRMKWIPMPECDPDRATARMILENISEAVHLEEIATENGREVATFRWTEFAMLAMDGSFYTADLFTVWIDLESKKVTRASLDDRSLSSQDVMTLVNFHIFFQGHPKVHAMANWGFNLETGWGMHDPFHRHSLITNMYNYFGTIIFTRLMKLFHMLGLCRSFQGIGEVFNHYPSKEPIHNHSAITNLYHHSHTVKFVVCLRRYFLQVFEDHKAEFPNVHGEAFFVGTVLHSLDHALWSGNLGDALWLDVESPDFGVMAEIGRFVKVGFSDDLPGLLFQKSFKEAPGAFYRKIYAMAWKLNPTFADLLDTCIVK